MLHYDYLNALAIEQFDWYVKIIFNGLICPLIPLKQMLIHFIGKICRS